VIATAQSRVWIDERDAIFRRGLGGWLDDYGFAVAGESAALDPPPCLDGVDILLFELASLDAAIAIERPAGARLVALVGAVRSDDLLNAANGPLAGIVVRDSLTPEGLATSLSAVASGHGSVPIDALRKLLRELRDSRKRASDDLHEREVAVLRLLADGGSTTEIASELAYSERTVKNIVHDVLMKLDCRTRAHAVALATRQGVI
jgi:DNA-binding NarL/FixJ family response regulator